MSKVLRDLDHLKQKRSENTITAAVNMKVLEDDFSNAKPEDFSIENMPQTVSRVTDGKAGILNIVIKNSGLICVGLISIFALVFSIKSSSAFKAANSSSSRLSGYVAAHEKKLISVDQSLSKMKSTSSTSTSEIESLKAKLATATKSLRQSEQEIAELSVNTEKMRSSIDDLKWELKDATNKHRELSSKVKTLQDAKLQR